MAQEERLAHLVVIGASSGGIDALGVLVSTLPVEFGAPIIVAQHLERRRPSHLEEILARRSTLPVHTVQDTHRLDPGVVYVVPSDRHVEMLDGAVRVLRDGDGVEHIGPKPSIDRLLRSAAAVYGEGLIAVILTGTGADGAAGAQEVKQAGGTVVIQNPATARYPAMPQSLAPTTVDLVAELETIGPLLHQLLTGPYQSTLPEDERRLQSMLARLRETSGIDFSSYKKPTILRRLQRRIVATDTHNLTEYVRYLQRHPAEYQRLASSFLIKVTGFFRDPALFHYLREQVLPELIRDAAARGNELRIWSAGCATGEEAYSLAILVVDALGDELEEFTIRVFATDLDADAIAFARRGIYPASALKDVPRELVERYFIPENDEYTLRKRVRALTVFGQHDLGQRAPFPRIDLAMCRNVLIYFTPELQKRALQLFAFSLRDGGYLVLGKAETTTPLPDFFVTADSPLRIFRRRGLDPVTLPSSRIRDATPAPALRHAEVEAAGRASRLSATAPSERPQLRPGRLRERSTNLLMRLPVGVLVVDRHYDIQTINGAARRLLGIHSAAMGEDLVHLVRTVPGEKLRGAVDAALREERAGISHQLAVDVVGGEEPSLQVDCYPYRPTPESEPHALVMVSEVTTAVRTERRLAAELAQAQAAVAEAERRHQEQLARLEQQVHGLAENNRLLLEANQELVETNQELLDENEELMAGHEETEAAKEEVETLNEELQATNEEQEPLNEELQATVEELNTTNDDMEARGAELQELATSLEAERSQLRAVLSSMMEPLVVVDRDGIPLLHNEAYEHVLGVAPEHTALYDEDGRLLPPEGTPQARAGRGESFLMSFVAAQRNGARRRFEARARPITGADGNWGSVITFREIDSAGGSPLEAAAAPSVRETEPRESEPREAGPRADA